MKKLLLLVLALLPLLASCGGDDDDNNNGGGSSSTSIEGVWFEKSEYTPNPEAEMPPNSLATLTKNAKYCYNSLKYQI